MPLPFIDDGPSDGSRFFHDSSDKGGNDGLDLAGFEVLEEEFFYGVDASELPALNSRISRSVSQDIPEIADLTGLTDVHIENCLVAVIAAPIGLLIGTP